MDNVYKSYSRAYSSKIRWPKVTKLVLHTLRKMIEYTGKNGNPYTQRVREIYGMLNIRECTDPYIHKPVYLEYTGFDVRGCTNTVHSCYKIILNYVINLGPFMFHLTAYVIWTTFKSLTYTIFPCYVNK